jgi:hypothetical protein
MYRNHMVLALLSRAAAVAVLCLAVAWLTGMLGRFEIEHTSKMSHQELLAYVRDGADASFGERYLVQVILSVVFVGLVELLAAGFRVIVSPTAETPLARPDYQ